MFTVKPGHYVLYIPKINKYIGNGECGYPSLLDLPSLTLCGSRMGTVYLSKQSAREYIKLLKDFDMLSNISLTQGLTVDDIEVKELSYNLEEIKL